MIITSQVLSMASVK